MVSLITDLCAGFELKWKSSYPIIHIMNPQFLQQWWKLMLHFYLKTEDLLNHIVEHMQI